MTRQETESYIYCAAVAHHAAFNTRLPYNKIFRAASQRFRKTANAQEEVIAALASMKGEIDQDCFTIEYLIEGAKYYIEVLD